ncbi:hypothetical protein UFOVP123_23 [uncultured Caudovirales phage]|uniref:DUF7936 domain-containing protein n=1 Tax=uncultured Caudovirales phage TaxID=2100421 RepID=A0A6J5L9K6_9CAUD|nr:hypothetical protein UFOVP123_23 [uncultured Caudovirales phage]
MSATITWVIEWMQCKPTEGSLTDVVVTAGWRCNGAETANSVDYSATSYGTASFPMPEGSFTPYEQLTQDQVLGWCWASGVDQTATEASVQAAIDNQINPPIVQPPLPWATAPTESA